MSLYPYRFVILFGAIFATMLFGYVVDLRVIQADEADLAQSEHDLQYQLQQSTRYARRDETLSVDRLNQSMQLQDFLQILHESDVALLSISKAAANDLSDVSLESYQLILASDYQPLIQLLRRLSLQAERYLLQRFVMSVDAKNSLRVELLLSLHASTRLKHAARLKTTMLPQNPFCQAGNGMMRQPVIRQANFFALAEVRVLGVVSHHGQRAAVILFPNGVVEEMSVGSVLGKEGGKVSSIQANAVQVQLPGKREPLILHHGMSLQ